MRQCTTPDRYGRAKFDSLTGGIFPPVSWQLDGQLAAVICIEDPLRTEAAEVVIRQLKECWI